MPGLFYIEGGVAPELAAMTDAGAVAVRLGPTVLRTSTAAAVGLGAPGVLTPRWDLLDEQSRSRSG